MTGPRLNGENNDRIPVVHVKGNHYEVGLQLGMRLKHNIAAQIAELKKNQNWSRIRSEAAQFLHCSQQYLPGYVAEIKGAADGAGLELNDVFATLCEELFSAGYRYATGCTDLVASGDVTANGSVLVGHNNDIRASLQKSLIIVHYQVDGEPEIMAVGAGGLGISVGFNSAGISLTGNELSPNDMRVGVPRMLLVRSILAATRIGAAIDAAVLDQRASNYNQVIADSNGEVYSIEGSATDFAPIYATDGYLAHANHYVSSKMAKFEFDSACIGDSLARYHRALRLLKNNLGRIDLEKMKQFLSDHVNYPHSICYHGETIKTAFSVIINLTTLEMWLTNGNPCEKKYMVHRPFT